MKEHYEQPQTAVRLKGGILGSAIAIMQPLPAWSEKRVADPVRRESAPDEDAPLVERIATGDHGAVRLLVARHGSRIHAVARRMLGNEADAEDVTQEVFTRVWRHAANWEPGRARFETWMHRVALNLCYDRLRRRREVTVDMLPDVVDPTPSVLEAKQRAEVQARVQGALAKLPERQRAAIVLCNYEGQSNIDAAAALEISVDALESLLARARRSLKEMLSAEAAELLSGFE